VCVVCVCVLLNEPTCSDRTQVKQHHRVLPVGRRMPYMVVGVPFMAASMLAFPFLEHQFVPPSSL
jgi:hypothetical protein